MTPLTLDLPTESKGHWILRRDDSDEWCSLACSTDGWTLSIDGGEFTVLAESGRGGPDTREIDALRARLRKQGWNEASSVSLRRKPDRRHQPPADRPSRVGATTAAPLTR